MSLLSKVVNRAAKNYMDDVTVLSTIGMKVGDRNDESTYVAGTELRSIQQALITYTASMQSSLRDYLEQFQVDLVLDFFPTADLSGDNVRFVVNGEEFAQKEASKEVADFFTRAGKERIFRTVMAVRTGRIEGSIRYVSSSEQLDLYYYDVASGQFVWTNTASLAGRANMVISGSGVQFFFGASVSPAMQFASGELSVAGSIATGAAPVITDTPRLEFYVGPVPVAALTAAGVLTVRGSYPSASDPELRKALTWRDGNGGWLFGLCEGGLYAPA